MSRDYWCAGVVRGLPSHRSVVYSTYQSYTWNFLLCSHFEWEFTSLISTTTRLHSEKKNHSHGTHGMQLIAVQIGMHLLVWSHKKRKGTRERKRNRFTGGLSIPPFIPPGDFFHEICRPICGPEDNSTISSFVEKKALKQISKAIWTKNMAIWRFCNFTGGPLTGHPPRESGRFNSYPKQVALRYLKWWFSHSQNRFQPSLLKLQSGKLTYLIEDPPFSIGKYIDSMGPFSSQPCSKYQGVTPAFSGGWCPVDRWWSGQRCRRKRHKALPKKGESNDRAAANAAPPPKKKTHLSKSSTHFSLGGVRRLELRDFGTQKKIQTLFFRVCLFWYKFLGKRMGKHQNPQGFFPKSAKEQSLMNTQIAIEVSNLCFQSFVGHKTQACLGTGTKAPFKKKNSHSFSWRGCKNQCIIHCMITVCIYDYMILYVLHDSSYG